ncbi:MAG: barstar family protein [Acidobacteriota bacterium]
MKPSVIKIPVDGITDWRTFHDVFQRTFGFPSFYGRNMDAC